MKAGRYILWAGLVALVLSLLAVLGSWVVEQGWGQEPREDDDYYTQEEKAADQLAADENRTERVGGITDVVARGLELLAMVFL